MNDTVKATISDIRIASTETPRGSLSSLMKPRSFRAMDKSSTAWMNFRANREINRGVADSVSSDELRTAVASLDVQIEGERKPVALSHAAERGKASFRKFAAMSVEASEAGQVEESKLNSEGLSAIKSA